MWGNKFTDRVECTCLFSLTASENGLVGLKKNINGYNNGDGDVKRVFSRYKIHELLIDFQNDGIKTAIGVHFSWILGQGWKISEL